VAIVQISQITNRKGLAQDLPQLAGAELGWSTDTRQLWIGNGTLQDGAPVIGNTEILTEFSDLLNYTKNYTYKGQAAGYTVQTGPTPGTPVSNTLQSWLDQYASVLDFGAVGDGVTDDTDAINLALQQLYCIEINPQIRRSLFFPAGVYRVTGTINIPTYATLYGEGSDNSIIAADVGVEEYVAQTADSLQQTGVNIGTNGATPPQFITISNMGFTHNDPTESVFLLQSATNCRFQNVGFRGASTTANLTTTANGSIGVTISSTPTLICQQIGFDGCVFSGLVYGLNAVTFNPEPGNLFSAQSKGIIVSNSNFTTLYQGVVLDNQATNPTGPSPSGVRIVGSLFNIIYAEGIFFGNVTLNATGHNMFYDVGNGFTTSTGTPVASIITIQNNNNVSISDLFERTDPYATTYPRININNTTSIAMTSGEMLTMGTYTQATGQETALINNTTATIFSVSTSVAVAFMVTYTITRNTAYRTGTVMVSSNNSGSGLSSNEDYTQNSDTGITLSVTQTGTTVNFNYSSTNTGVPGEILYTVTYLA
jgi:hypothetical protein